jgi:hypothetical protein
MAHYMIALLNGGHYGNAQILSDTGIAELHRGVAEHTAMGIPIGKYGMGWYASNIGQTKVVWHTGMTPDFSSYMGLLPEQKRGVILLLNADHFPMDPILGWLGEGVATLLAGDQPDLPQFGFMPWVMRSLLLIPLLQIIGVTVTLRLVHRWRHDPMSHPSNGRKWGLHILLLLIPNLLVILTLIPILDPMRGFWMLFMPDFSWIAMICGGFAGIWLFLRTGLILRTLRKPQASKPSLGISEPIC